MPFMRTFHYFSLNSNRYYFKEFKRSSSIFDVENHAARKICGYRGNHLKSSQLDSHRQTNKSAQSSRKSAPGQTKTVPRAGKVLATIFWTMKGVIYSWTCYRNEKIDNYSSKLLNMILKVTRPHWCKRKYCSIPRQHTNTFILGYRRQTA